MSGRPLERLHNDSSCRARMLIDVAPIIAEEPFRL